MKKAWILLDNGRVFDVVFSGKLAAELIESNYGVKIPSDIKNEIMKFALYHSVSFPINKDIVTVTSMVITGDGR